MQMNLGVIVAGGPWRFFSEIFEDLSSRYKVSVFERRRVQVPFFNTRINRYLFETDLDSFLSKNDVVFFEWASELLAAATRLPKKTRIIARMHRYELFQWADKIRWENVDKLIVVSEAMQQKFTNRFPQHAHRTAVVKEAIDTKKFQMVNKPYGRDIGTLCFITPRKGVYELVLAFADLEARHPGFRLHIGGGGNKYGDYNEALFSLVAKLGLQDKVIFYGDIQKPWEWYRNIDIFISNSYSEGLQVAPMEAMASGRFTLSHHWDGAEELLPPQNLFLTPDQLEEKILAYDALDEGKRQRLQDQMREIALSNFNLQMKIDGVREVIEEVARAGRPEAMVATPA